MKALVWLLLGILVYWALRSQAKRSWDKRRQAQNRRDNSPDSAQLASHASTSVETMVACSYCQLYLPASEAIHQVTSSSEHYFCSEEHAVNFNSKKTIE